MSLKYKGTDNAFYALQDFYSRFSPPKQVEYVEELPIAIESIVIVLYVTNTMMLENYGMVLQFVTYVGFL
jgi:hypothetical protein